MNITAPLQSVWQDTVYALRTMRQNPLFAASAVLTLALGIGGSTAMFTVIRAVLLKPLSYPNSDELVQVAGGATPARFDNLRANARVFNGIGAFTPQEDMALAGTGEPEVLNGVQISAGFLNILGVRPLLGRGFLAAEDVPGAPSVALISFELWNRQFRSDPKIIGKSVVLGAQPRTIVGVLPARFVFPSTGIDIWLPRPAEWEVMAPKSRPLSPILNVFGRLKPGVSLTEANTETAVLHHRYAGLYPTMLDAKSKSPVELKRLKDELVGDVRTMLWMLFAAVSFVLLITCANVASLLLARATARGREFAIRSALGASRRRLMLQLLCESVLLSGVGGVIGILLAEWSLRTIPLLTAFDLPRANEIHLDAGVLLFAVAVSLGTGILFGLAPSLHASRLDVNGMLRGMGTAANTGPKLTTRGLLVVGQVALSFILLIGAALLMQSMANLRSVNLGFNPAHLLTARVSLQTSRYDTDQKRAAFFDDLVASLAATPGVRHAAAAMFLPMAGFVGSPVQDAGTTVLKLNQRPIATLLVVTPGYFETLNVPLRRGRDFTVRDRDGTEHVAIIDEATARHFWPDYPNGKDPIGQRLLIGGVNSHPARIIGIVAKVRQNLEDTSWPVTVYVALAQNAQPFAMLAIRTRGEPLGAASTIRERVRSLDREQPVSEVRTMDDLVDAGVGQRRLVVILLAAFAGAAVVLALIGIFGVISYSVTQRQQELGIRYALGAQRKDLLFLVMNQGAVLTLSGIGIGVAGALALTRFLSGMLFEVRQNDPATYILMGLTIALVGLAASYLPVRRATQTDPITALRV